MIEIWAIIRRDKVNATKRFLDSIGLGAMTIHSVWGRGKQAGFATSEIESIDIPVEYATAAPHLIPTDVKYSIEGNIKAGSKLTRPVIYIPKKLLVMVIPKEMKEEAIEGIISINRTGYHGDGKIFVMPVEEVVTIRTNESIKII
ncbi:MAG: P-II family nitrogen regulator [Hydrogenothermaceae bacterium]|nr:P-II family nitrogen regulator [Hydrogenothermaceae bacterium]